MLDKVVMRLSGIHKIMGLLVGLDVLQAIFIIGQAYFLSRAITGLWQGEVLSTQLPAVLLFMLSYAGRHVLTYFKDECLDHFARRESSQLRKQLLGKLFELGPHIVQEEGTGNVITMALDGIGLVENYLHLILSKMIKMSIIPWFILAAVSYTHLTLPTSDLV